MQEGYSAWKKKAVQDEVWKNNFQRENNEELTKPPREFILLDFFFSPSVIAVEEAGTEMTSLSQVISLVHLWGKLDEMKGNFPRTQPVVLESSSAAEKQSYIQKGILLRDTG